MGHLTYGESKALATKTILILAVITVAEVLVALLGKGYLKEGFEMNGALLGGIMIIMSIVKAYLIIFEFMHMKYEIPGLVKSVLLPTLLLVWGAIAFTWEGAYWHNTRNKIKDKNEAPVQEVGMMADEYKIEQIG
ncbi:MAG: cytochrome C oxidase subunit IV family protein [Saprospiraceae bacterium]|nr:cytochrome C oxidase subunit IV family protein [Saprospiraceae bacterium]